MLSVVIPVYNSALTLPALVAKLEAQLPGMTPIFEVLLINDGSRDASWSTIEQLAVGRPWLRGFNLMRNYGQHNALLCGIRSAHGLIVVTIDDDLQHPIEEIPKLIDKLEEGHDVVYGVPIARQQFFLRNVGSWLTRKILSHVMGQQAASHVSAFRAFRRNVIDASSQYEGPSVNLDVLLTWGTSKFSFVITEHATRPEGASNYNVWSLLIHASNMVTGLTTVPLQVASFLGLVLTVIGVVLLLFVLCTYFLWGRVVPGFYFLASLMILSCGAQLFSLGLIGEYIARMHFHAMRRNTYHIREELNKPCL